MAAFMKMAGIEGEATDSGHKSWIKIESMSSPVFRSIAEGAKDHERSRGTTTLGDIVVVRQLDKSSVKLQEACANGTPYKEVEIHFCTQANNKEEPYLKYKLENVIVSSYSFHGNSSGDPKPTEEITLNATKATWTYTTIDPEKLTPKGNVEGKYSPGEGKA
jgi:type VI secretion system secreted protein Hcp